MTAFESEESHVNPHSEEPDSHRKRKKRKSHNSEENQTFYAPNLSSLEVVPDDSYSDAKKHKRKRHKTSEKFEFVEESTQNAELGNPVAKKHKRQHENTLTSEVGDNCLDSVAPVEPSQSPGSTSKKRKKRSKENITEVTEEHLFGDESFAPEGLSSERKRKKRHKNNPSDATENRLELDLHQTDEISDRTQAEEIVSEVTTELQSTSGKKERHKKHKHHHREPSSEELQDNGLHQDTQCATEEKKKHKKHKKRHHKEASSGETCDNQDHLNQNEPSENATEVITKKKKKRRSLEANLAENILKRLTAIDEDVLKASQRRKSAELKQKKKKKAKGPDEAEKTIDESKEKKSNKVLSEAEKSKALTNRDMTHEELQQLFSQLLKILPANDSLNYASRELFVDWDLVKFDNFSSEFCKQQWLMVSSKVRKMRSLYEIAQAAKNGEKSKNSTPKLSGPAILFMKEISASLREEYLNSTEDKLMVEANKRFNKLSADEKKKYMDKFNDWKANFNGIDIEQATLCSGLELFVSKKVKKYLQTHPKAEHGKLVRKFEKRWRKMSNRHKAKYICQAQAHFKKILQEGAPLRHGKKSIRSKIPARIRTLMAEEKKILDEVYRVPPKPVRSGFLLFWEKTVANVRKEMPNSSRKEVMNEVGRRWFSIPKDERDQYAKDAENRNRKYEAFMKRHPEMDHRNLTTAPLATKKDNVAVKRDPQKLPCSAYQLFCTEFLATLKGSGKKHTIAFAAKRWAELSEEERSSYNEKFLAQKEKYQKKLSKTGSNVTVRKRKKRKKNVSSEGRDVDPAVVSESFDIGAQNSEEKAPSRRVSDSGLSEASDEF